MRYRTEKDGLGKKQIPAEAYYGIGSLRSKDTFQLSKHGLCRQMIKAIAIIKKAAAKANLDLQLITREVADAIVLSCDEILNGRLHGQFITDVVQGGSGASMNTNANEVIANRANEMLGGEKGKYNLVHPLRDVDFGQNSADVVLLAGKITTIRLVKKLLTETKKLHNSYYAKAEEYGSKRNATGLELAAFAGVLERDMKKIDTSALALHEISFHYAPEGEEYNEEYTNKFMKYLCAFSGENFVLARNGYDISRNLDSLLWMASALKIASVNLAKVAGDINILANSGKMIISQQITETQEPIVIDMVKQVSAYIMGNELTISRSIEAGELAGNAYFPIIFACMFEMINLLRRTSRIFREKVIEELVLII